MAPKEARSTRGDHTFEPAIARPAMVRASVDHREIERSAGSHAALAKTQGEVDILVVEEEALVKAPHPLEGIAPQEEAGTSDPVDDGVARRRLHELSREESRERRSRPTCPSINLAIWGKDDGADRADLT